MNERRRPLSLANLRAFEAVARLASFSAAAEELFLTQSAISRQIRGLEDELGAALFVRGTRHVETTQDAQILLRAVEPWLARLDAGVRQIREKRTRRRVSVTTFASFASLWLLPRIEAFQRQHPDIDIRVSAHDALSDLDDPEIDLALRYCSAQQAPAGALRLFGETLTPAVSRQLMQRIRAGEAPPLARPADLARHTLAEEDDHRASAEYLSWRHWLAQHGEPALQPRRWLYLNFTYQQVQAALAGQGVALARVALVADAIERGELVEPFGTAGRITSPYCYWLVSTPASRARAEVAQFCDWVEAQAALTRAATGEDDDATAPRPAR
ncbi:LysR substrate-binding domain-containing protein [Piscinibacter sp.]|uniref:LysR substrate-binding domain-containing protein n=1 Tax=Piscinibacter sp. TaxID=1903157 RepID=UPI0039E33ADE